MRMALVSKVKAHHEDHPAPEPVGRAPRADAAVDPPGRALHRPLSLGAFAGGAVHQNGAFFRYELEAGAEFRHYQLGLSFVGGRARLRGIEERAEEGGLHL